MSLCKTLQLQCFDWKNLDILGSLSHLRAVFRCERLHTWSFEQNDFCAETDLTNQPDLTEMFIVAFCYRQKDQPDIYLISSNKGCFGNGTLRIGNWEYGTHCNRGVKHHVYVKRQTRLCTTWPSFRFTCRLLFMISTPKLEVWRNFLSIRIVLSCFYLITQLPNFQTTLYWIRYIIPCKFAVTLGQHNELKLYQVTGRRPKKGINLFHKKEHW